MKNFLTALVCTALTIWAPVSVAVAQSSASPNLNANPAVLPQGTPMVVELSKSIAAKKARKGDTVKADVMQDVVAHGELVVRRGSKVEGHVTEAQGYTKEQPQSVLGVIFDKVLLKGGGEMNVSAVVLALALPVPKADVLSSSTYGGGATGGTQPVSRGKARPLVDPRDRIDHTRDNALRDASDLHTYGTANTLHGGLLSSGNRGVFGMPAVSLKAAPGSSEQIMVSDKSSIKLESGTQMVLEVMAGRHP